MFNIQNKYNENGCYRFLNNEAKTIYIGKSKNIHRRLFSQHFKKNGSFGHLPKQCYKDTCKIEIITTKDHTQTLSLEQYLIDTYMPRYNNMDKRKDIFTPTEFYNIDKYKKLEKWKLYFTFKEYDFNKITTSHTQNKLAIIVTFLFFISILLYFCKDF
ncbi:MAG: GIY-YIG nuclease family protein [Romboutsia sp.]